EDICVGLKQIAAENPAVEMVYPVHLNPNVQEPVYRLLGSTANIHLMEPQDYLPMVHLMRNASLILTDSGGVQEEATALGIPTLVLREVTERPEGIQAGTLKLVGTDPARMAAEAKKALQPSQNRFSQFATYNPFGDGHAAERIVKILLKEQESRAEDVKSHTS
ncbi:MAG: UDP-N-acetylglucosamine 2-epimerase, partial [Anaerolineaceae bacterium]